MALTFTVNRETFPLAQVFRISRGAKTAAEVIIVTVSDGTHTGWGESVPYARYGESLESVTAQIEAVIPSLANLTDHNKLPDLLPAGSARNALDCAFWDLTAKVSGSPVSSLLALPVSQHCFTAQTISVDTIDNMRASAAKLQGAPLIKVKLDPDSVVEKVRAIHQASPQSQLIVDANEGWTVDALKAVANDLKACNVVLIEQPVPANEDAALEGYHCPVPLCADESCHTSDNLETLRKRYQAINIKLDKTGGLTEAVALYKRAKAMDFSIMVGCMVGTSLAMAPAYLLCDGADFVDLDGPLLIANDRPNGFVFENGNMTCPKNFLWGL
ncbi:N-acetyl-D-Glu racemase DgcA [Aestuariibacter sp. A3R04]|uniref:N-acetyl-D-Glu racemase DgcA n=1 Tax=Aestuariibacter sp. A3R04 TaxID=2841571 RepID=UPI001C0A1619|nr:N-acetyl-D-Glu racemase DgcA [Aestuariibacter sp. A3R04]MBU3021024.1 dipeptide epimerase [Aestuariibacter sp. A3R04]